MRPAGACWVLITQNHHKLQGKIRRDKAHKSTKDNYSDEKLRKNSQMATIRGHPPQKSICVESCFLHVGCTITVLCVCVTVCVDPLKSHCVATTRHLVAGECHCSSKHVSTCCLLTWEQIHQSPLVVSSVWTEGGQWWTHALRHNGS